MKNILLLILICFVFSNCKTIKEKTTNDLSFIDNRKVKYSIRWSKIDTTLWSWHFYSVASNLKEEQLEKTKKITPQKWLSLLENGKTDFASDLILYDLYRKRAEMFVVLKDFKSKKRIELWKKHEKSTEIQYWKSYFEKQQN